MAEPTPEPNVPDHLQQLQEKKLIAEINNLTKPFFKRIEFWQFISTFSIAALTYFVLYFNGAFDTKTKYLEMQRNNLIQDIEKFKKDTIGFSRQKQEMQKEIETMNNQRINDSLMGIKYRETVDYYKSQAKEEQKNAKF